MCTSTAMEESTIDEVISGLRRAIAGIRPALAL
jgi:hypothetical protein